MAYSHILSHFILFLMVIFLTVTYGEECSCGVKQSERIVGGQAASAKEYPWMAALVEKGGLICGASIIHREWILTAAHCFSDAPNPDDYSIILGDHDLTSTEPDSWHKVWDIIIHSSYVASTFDNDIALVELLVPITYGEGIAPVCLPFDLTAAEVSGEKLHTIGWGKLKEGGSSTLELQELPIPILSTKQCKKYYKTGLTNNMFCAYKSGYDTCQGDSGGPATYDQDGKHIQLGVVSWGAGCARHKKPGVYTKLQNYVDWIKETTEASFCRVEKTSSVSAGESSNTIEGSLTITGDLIVKGSVISKDASSRKAKSLRRR